MFFRYKISSQANHSTSIVGTKANKKNNNNKFFNWVTNFILIHKDEIGRENFERNRCVSVNFC